MKINKFFLVGLLCASLGFTSCDSDDKTSGRDPIPYQREVMAKINNKLVESEHGWVINFFPDNNAFRAGSPSYGGYYLWMDFSDDNTVSVRSDFNQIDLNASIEEYNFVMLKSFSLNFPVQGKIHHFTKTNPFAYRTDIEFVYYNVDGDDIIFRGHTTKNFIRFRKATKELKDDYLKLEEVRETFNSFRNILITGNGEPQVLSFVSDATQGPDGRVFRFNDPGFFKNAQQVHFGVSCGSDIIVINEPILIRDAELREFKLVDGKYVAEHNGVKATLL